MANLRNEIFEYAEGLYTKALHWMDKQGYRMTDVYALSSCGAAAFVAADPNAPQGLRDQAASLEQAAWILSKQAHAAERTKMVAPRLQGNEDELEDVRRDIWSTAEEVFRRRNRHKR